MKKKVYDCLGKELKEGDLISISSLKSIYMIIKHCGKYFLHPVNDKNIFKDYEKLKEDMLENKIFTLNSISSKKNIYKLDVWNYKLGSALNFCLEEEKEKKVLKEYREKQRASNINHENKKNTRKI